MAIKKSTLAGVCAACAAVVIMGGGYAVSLSGYPTLLKNARAVVQEQLNATFVDLIGNPAKLLVDFSEPRLSLFNHEVTMVIVNEDSSDIVRLPMTIDTKFLGYDFTFDLAHATVNDENALKYLDFSNITNLESTGSYHILTDKFKIKVDSSYLTNAEAIVNVAANLKALNSYFEQQQEQKTPTEVQSTEIASEPQVEESGVEAESKTKEQVAQDTKIASEALASEPDTPVASTGPVAESKDVAVVDAEEKPLQDEEKAEEESKTSDEVSKLFAQYVEQFKQDINLKKVGNLSFELSANGDEKVMISVEIDSLAQENVVWQNLSLFTEFYGLSNLKSLEQLDLSADGLTVINNDGYDLIKNAVFHLNNAKRGLTSKNFPFSLDVAQCYKLVDYHSSGMLQNFNITMLDDQQLPLSFRQYLEQYPITISVNKGSSFGLNTFVKQDEFSEAVLTTVPVHFSGTLGSYIAETSIEANGTDSTKVRKHPVFYSDFVFNADVDFSKVDDNIIDNFKSFFEISGNKSTAQIRYEFDGYDEKLIVNGKEQ